MSRHFGSGGMKSYDEWLVEKLRDPKRALSYLKSEFEEFEIDGDVEALKNALSIYLRSQQYVLGNSVSILDSSTLLARSRLISALFQAGYDSSRLAEVPTTSPIVIPKEDFDSQGHLDNPIKVNVSIGEVVPI